MTGRFTSTGFKEVPDPLPTHELLADIAQAVGVFQTEGGFSFAHYEAGWRGRRNVPLRSLELREWLAETCHRQHDRPAKPAQLRECVGNLESKATAGAVTIRNLAHRVAGTDRSTFTQDNPRRPSIIGIDLGHSSGRAIEITAAGWKLDTNREFAFWHPAGYLRLPDPQPTPVDDRAATITAFRSLTNLTSDNDWLRTVGWLLAALHPKMSRPMLVIHGPTGSGKSTAARFIRSLIDPIEAPLRPLSASHSSLTDHALNNWIMAFDCVSRIPGRTSDLLSQLTTGAGLEYSTRITRRERIPVTVARPIMMTAHPDLKLRDDLTARSLTVTLEPLKDVRTEVDLLDQYAALRPRLLALLCDAVALALSVGRASSPQPGFSPASGPFPDATAWILAACPALGIDPADMLAALTEPPKLHVNPFTQSILDFMSTRDFATWKGTPTEIAVAVHYTQAASEFSRRLRDCEPILAHHGIQVDFDHAHAGRVITLTRLQNQHIANHPSRRRAPQPIVTAPPPIVAEPRPQEAVEN